MRHADTLRGMASGSHPGLSYSAVVALIAGVEALEAIDRVRNALSSIARAKADSEAARDHGHDNTDWHETTADALEYVLDLLTEALEGDNE